MKKYFISVLEVPLNYQDDNWDNSKLKNNMWLTAQPIYKSVKVRWDELPSLFKSDYRQLSPFEYIGGVKKSENWNNENQDLLIFDIDDGLPLTEARDMFSRYKHFIYTTKSHQVDKKGVICDRYRIIFPAVNVPAGEEYFEIMRILEDKYSFIDVQVNNKTGAFLGNYDCEIFLNNNGIDFDFKVFTNIKSKLVTINPTQTPILVANSIPRSDNYDNSNQMDVEHIKSRLTRDMVASIVSSYGYDVNRKFMFKYRMGERTPSASISPDLLIKDFGGDLSTDVIGFIQEVSNVNFKEALEIVARYQ
jgi:hypothetical protein